MTNSLPQFGSFIEMARKSTLLTAGIVIIGLAGSAYFYARDDITALLSPDSQSAAQSQKPANAAERGPAGHC